MRGPERCESEHRPRITQAPPFRSRSPLPSTRHCPPGAPDPPLPPSLHAHYARHTCLDDCLVCSESNPGPGAPNFGPQLG